MPENIRPSYYGGPDNPYEVVKVIDAWGPLCFRLGSALRYICRAGQKVVGHSDPVGAAIEDLTKARTYIDMKIESLKKEQEQNGPR